MKVCALPGANRNISRNAFPLPEYDIEENGPGTAILGGGCFWCTEAVYRQLSGVLRVESGYAGGDATTANYQAVCTGTTGHAEVIKIEYDPAQVSFGQILRVFFSVAHDPTQLNRQGADQGTQYRSVVFAQTPEQSEVTERYIEQLGQAQAFNQPIVTAIEQGTYYPAEDYHQDYAAQNPEQPYIASVAAPKVAKLRQKLGEMCD